MVIGLDCHARDPGSIPGACSYFIIFFIAVKILSPEDSLAIWHQDGAYGLTLYFSNLNQYYVITTRYVQDFQ